MTPDPVHPASGTPADNDSPHPSPSLPARQDPDTAPPADSTPAPAPTAPPAATTTGRASLAGATWMSLIAGAVLGIGLLVFIMQNQQPVQLTLFLWQFELPLGVCVLLSCIVAALIMGVIGGVRMLQLRKEIKKLRRAR
ncbi:lipopolysaccharide assembly LapA domain-containing protein [Corynebacterium mendelii]|uniref:DUF1049 domain-containing protein n=1 Tax=Corynebacterium mendelii TaxID=2765362 RepID=A0A939DYK8_9CORY|nr:lipopolysaccharide assembly protein LapA domain-containing protein [Corynebacterium mendelii]MBN9643226.1 DUF1049 domain-containing protein [Corynebacterium mendelii]